MQVVARRRELGAGTAILTCKCIAVASLATQDTDSAREELTPWKLSGALFLVERTRTPRCGQKRRADSSLVWLLAGSIRGSSHFLRSQPLKPTDPCTTSHSLQNQDQPSIILRESLTTHGLQPLRDTCTANLPNPSAVTIIDFFLIQHYLKETRGIAIKAKGLQGLHLGPSEERTTATVVRSPMAHLPEKLPIVSSSGDAGSGPMTKLELVAVNADAQQQLLKLGLRFDAQGMRAREEEENFLVPAHSGRAALRTRQASWKRPRAEATLSSVPLRTHSERSWQQGGDENAHHGSDNTPLDDAVILIQA